MGSIKKNLITTTTTTTTTTTKQNKTHAYFPIYSLSLIFKVTARAACLLTYLVLTLVLFTERYASVNSSCAQHITTQRILLEKTQIGSSVKDRGL